MKMNRLEDDLLVYILRLVSNARAVLAVSECSRLHARLANSWVVWRHRGFDEPLVERAVNRLAVGGCEGAQLKVAFERLRSNKLFDSHILWRRCELCRRCAHEP